MQPLHNVYQVREITHILQTFLQSEPVFQDVWIEGEVSNFVRPSSGHVYFTLKDNNSQIRCAIFRSDAARLRFPLKDGDAVQVHGRLSIYDARSEYQIIGDRVEPAGVGLLQQAFERLKEQLAAEGLFDPIHKKPLPKFPRKIGVITSATGAAIRDILRMLQKRYPVVEVLLFPTLVQGEDAAAEIAHAIACMNRLPDIDLLIVGRGGGSIEDLWAFNEEVVARAIFASRVPVVSAVGHETDFTIADLVADHRAPTPSAAVEHVVPDQEELHRQITELESRFVRSIVERIHAARTKLENTQNRLSPARQVDSLNRFQQTVDQLEIRGQRAIAQQIARQRQRLDRLNGDLGHLNPTARIHSLRARLDQLNHVYGSLMQRQIDAKVQAWQVASARLDVLSPLRTLARGYSVSRDLNGRTITDAATVSVGDDIEVQLARGALACTVLKGKIDG
ncbi:MAG: exodeoxyribonuclease VII large subunit [Candidatus Poribacteria bacterium]|nr:exodeoxyribonuclease VII large subunit [Candidatus Poribacteria bacterium]